MGITVSRTRSIVNSSRDGSNHRSMAYTIFVSLRPNNRLASSGTQEYALQHNGCSERNEHFTRINGAQLFEHSVMYLFLSAFEPFTGTLRTKTRSSAMGGYGPLKWGPPYQHQVPGMLMFNVLAMTSI
jgi:hypothetical protein